MRYERERKNMGEPKCIYCGTSKDLSNSDIIPDALTASRIINKCVCHVEHNSGMTKKFESEVAEKLAFLLNYLNIKSKKSNHFPTYEADYVIAGIRYHDKKVVKEHDFINKKILWSENNESAFGPYEKIEQIAKSKKTNKGYIEQIDINTQVIESHIPLKYEVFFSEAMHRQVAKIAYEWYCLKNKVEDKYEDFSDIIAYILDGGNDQVVKMVTDKILLDKFSEFCHDGSHAMLAYIDNQGGISVLVDIFGVAVYDIKVCKHIPTFCENNCILQKINIDGSGNRECECLCVHDYNDIVSDMINGMSESTDFPAQEIGGLQCHVMMPQNQHINYNLFVLDILHILGKGVAGIHGGNQYVVDFVLNQLQDLLNTDVIHKRGLKRFVEDNIGSDEIKINEENIGEHSIFYYYILYKLGESEIQALDDKVVEQFIINLFNTRKIDSREVNMREKLEEMLREEKYSELIKLGACKIRNW